METKTYTTLIEAPELAGLLNTPAVAIFDCRWDIARPEWGDAAYAEAHIPGAVFASMDRDLADPVGPRTGRHPLPDIDRFVEKLSRWGIDATAQVVAYDQGNGAAASRLWWLLRWLGHRRVAVLNGGFAAWTAGGWPVTKEAFAREPRIFTPNVHSSSVVSSTEVANAVAEQRAAAATDTRILQPHDGATAEVARINAPRMIEGSQSDASASAESANFHGGVHLVDSGPASASSAITSASVPLIVDARAADRFAGQNETIDPVAGHVPGARNHPFARNLDPSGKFLAPAELRQRWQETLGNHTPENVIAMCGSGVTACHNLLAMEVAGFSGARLYAGSWSEWIKDRNRPVETLRTKPD